MPIFSSNRVSYGGSVVADKTYTENDMGRIMQECAINDMKIFNAALARDFKEISAQNEGTMLESELQTFQEFSIKEAWKSLKEKIKKLWAKIKGVFKTVFAKLTVFLVRNNKTFIAMHRKELLGKNCNECKLPKYRNPKKDVSKMFSSGKIKSALDYIETLDPANKKEFGDAMTGTSKKDTGIAGNTYNVSRENRRTTNSNDSSDDGYQGIKSYNKVGDEKEIQSASDMYDDALKENYDEENDSLTFAKSYYHGDVNKLLTALSTNSSTLKALKEQNRKIDSKFKSLLGKIEKAQKAAGGNNNIYTTYSKYVTRYQTFITNLTNCSIRIVKFAIKNDRGLIGTLVAYNPKAKNETAYLESAYMEGYDRLFMETEDMDPEDVEAAAEEEGIDIEITVSGADADVEINDDTGDDDE